MVKGSTRNDPISNFELKHFFSHHFDQSDYVPIPWGMKEEIGTILCAERWCCLSSLLGYWAQSWMGSHSDTGYQQGGTHFANLGRMMGRVNPT